MRVHLALRVTACTALAAAAFAYSLHERAAVPPIGSGLASAMALSVRDTLSSAYFTAYAILTLWLLHCVTDVRIASRLPALIRVGSYRRLVRAVTASSLRTLRMPTVFVVGGASIAPIVVPDARDSLEGAATESTLHTLGHSLAQILLFVVMLTLIRLLIEVGAIVAGYGITVALSCTLWTWAAVSAGGLLDLTPPADFRTYSLLATFLPHPALAMTVACTYLAIVLSIALAVWIMDRAVRDGLPSLRPTLLPVGCALVLIVLATAAMSTASEGLQEHLVAIFLGPQGTVLQMLLSLVLVMGYVFHAYLRLVREHGTARSAITLIRYGSRTAQLVALLRGESVRAIVYSLGLVVAAVFAYLAFGGRSLALDPEQAVLLLYQLVIVQTLQLLFLITCINAAVTLRDVPHAGFTTVAIMTGLSALPIPASSLVPIQRGTSSILFDGGWTASLLITLTLLCGIAGALLVAAAPHTTRRSLERRVPPIPERQS